MAKFEVEFNDTRCKGCMLCISVCARKILEIKKDKINIFGYQTPGITDEELCIGCAGCALICPDLAIQIYKNNTESS